ncbi:MAG TPA: DNA polymerase IV, partial [Burkholderiaceae bacterium]|nr:DNA polymerase IV [Burkholderiaceae bacterium]
MFALQPTILHADLDAFFASVEQRDDPALRGRPVIVGGGVVLAASYEARAMGVRGAMGGRRARALCPQAIVVRPRMEAYSAASRAVFAVFRDTSPVVEGISIDEAFLDVRGMEAIAWPPAEIAARLRARVRDEVGLPLTVGVARTKHLAKIASAVAKPDGLLVVGTDPDSERSFLHPLAVEHIWGVGPKTASVLHGAGVRTVGQLAAADEGALVELLGRHRGGRLHALANNRDTRPVRPGRRRRSIGSQSALGRRARSAGEIDAILLALVDRITRRLRAADLACRTVVLRLRFGDDYARATRSASLD